LFRPVGLRIFAELTSELVKQEGRSLNEALRILRKLPSDLAAVPYVRVIWLPNGRMNPRARALCKRLLLYMVGRGKDIEALRRDYAKQLEKDEGKVRLPEPVV
jgi:hypothetical protein